MSPNDKTRLAAGCICSTLSGLPFYRDAFHLFLAALICFTVAAALAFVIAGRSHPRNWKRISVWFFCLSIVVPSVVFILLFQFREGL
jgi:cell division protein FtsW (lipid II flippase)